MGEFNASDSWNNMNEWTPNIKSEKLDDNSASHSSNFSLEVKSENEGNYQQQQSYQYGREAIDQSTSDDPDDFTVIIQEVDPHLVTTPDNAKQRRRRGSGPTPETPEERAVRLAKMSAYAALRLANETPEQRAVRLKRMSEYAAKRLSRETSEQRAKRLSRMSEYAARRLARETPEQRQARLSRMSEYAKKRRYTPKQKSNDVEEMVPTDPLSIPDQS